MGAAGAFCGGRKIWFIPACALVLAVSFAAVGFAAETKSSDRLSELIKLVGLDTAFNHAAAGMKAGADQALANTSLNAADQEKVLSAWSAAADAAFAPETLRRDFLRAMDGELNKADLDVIVAFFRTPLGARMTALENARTAAGPDAPLRQAGELTAQLKSEPERAQVLKLMESSLRMAEIATDLAFNLGRATAIGMAAADEKTTTLPDEAIQVIDRALQKMRPAIAAQLKERVALSIAYTYREASIPELRQYLAFLTSPAGKKLYGTMLPALHGALIKAGGEFGHALMRELGKERA